MSEDTKNDSSAEQELPKYLKDAKEAKKRGRPAKSSVDEDNQHKITETVKTLETATDNTVDTDILKIEKEVTKSRLTFEEKKALRRKAMKDYNALDMEDKLKEPGKRYRLCNLLPGNIEYWRSRGYEISKTNFSKQTGYTAAPTSANGLNEVAVGKTSDLKAVWMETSLENHEVLEAIENENAEAQDAIIGESEIPEANRLSTNKVQIEKYSK